MLESFDIRRRLLDQRQVANLWPPDVFLCLRCLGFCRSPRLSRFSWSSVARPTEQQIVLGQMCVHMSAPWCLGHGPRRFTPHHSVCPLYALSASEACSDALSHRWTSLRSTVIHWLTCTFLYFKKTGDISIMQLHLRKIHSRVARSR